MSGLGKGAQRRQVVTGDETKHRATKDRRRWCKGIEGREHVWHWAESRRGYRRSPAVVESHMECANCRRHRGLAYALCEYGNRRNPPEWSSDARRTFEETPVYLDGRYQLVYPHKFYGPAF